MKLLRQMLIILAVSFAGEGLHQLLPLPVPASIYGILLMLALLCLKIVKVEQVETVGNYLIEIMPLMFVPPIVKLIGVWDVVQAMLLPFLCIIVVSTLVVMACAGRVTQAVIRLEKRKAAGKGEDAA